MGRGGDVSTERMTSSSALEGSDFGRGHDPAHGLWHAAEEGVGAPALDVAHAAGRHGEGVDHVVAVLAVDGHQVAWHVLLAAVRSWPRREAARQLSARTIRISSQTKSLFIIDSLIIM